MNFPILSAIIFIPLIGSFFILITKGNQINVERNSKYVAIFSSLINFFLSLFLWHSFDKNSSDIEAMQKIHKIIESWIVENPNQWFWQHNRFN